MGLRFLAVSYFVFWLCVDEKRFPSVSSPSLTLYMACETI